MTTIITPAYPAGTDPTTITCQGDAGCREPATTLLWFYHPTEVGIDGILVCDGHVVTGRKTVSRRTSAVVWTTPLASEPVPTVEVRTMNPGTPREFGRVFLFCPAGHEVLSAPVESRNGAKVLASDYSGEFCGHGSCPWVGATA